MPIAYASEGTRLATTASTWNVPAPATVNAGDLLVLHVVTNASAVNSVPSGWVEVYNEATLTNPRGGLWYKVANGTEGGTTVTVTTVASVQGGAQIFRYTGVDTSSPIDGTPTNVRNTTAAVTTVLPSITVASTGAMLIYANGANSSTTTMSSTTGTERVDHGALGSAKAGALYDELLSSSGATGTRTITISASRENFGAMFALKPSASVVDIAVPVTAVTMTAPAPEVSVGVNLDIPVSTVTVDALSPAVSVGVDLSIPSAAVTVTAYDPVVTVLGDGLEVPQMSITVSAYAPDVVLGVNVEIPVAAVTLSAPSPDVSVGVTLDIPTANIAVTAYTPDVIPEPPGDSVDVSVPMIHISVWAQDPSATTGINMQVPTATITVDAWAPIADTPLVIAIPTATVTVVARAPFVYIVSLEGRDLSFEITAVPIRPTTLVHKERSRRFTIYASAGERELVGAKLKEIKGQDISTCTFEIALGTATQPQPWEPPSMNDPGANNSERIVKLLVSSENAEPGYYYIWIKVIDEVEIPLIRVPGLFRVR